MDENIMKQIPLTQGKVALVDNEDYDWLNQYKWYADYRKGIGSFYAVRQSLQKSGKRHQISMAREILGLKYKDLRQADHINHVTLDNRRSELRICTRSQNQMNRKLVLKISSKFKGVSWHKLTKKWMAYITKDKKRKYLGLFTLEQDAALAYNEIAKKYFGNFAYLNNIS